MFSFLTSRRKRSIFYKVFCVIIVLSCFLLWRRKGALRSGGSGSIADQFSDFSAKHKAGFGQNKRSERSGDMQSINAIDDNDILPVKSVPNFDVAGMPNSNDKLRNEVDDMRNAFGISQHKGLEQYDSEIDSDLKKIVQGEKSRSGERSFFRGGGLFRQHYTNDLVSSRAMIMFWPPPCPVCLTPICLPRSGCRWRARPPLRR